jgi:hypothetical protein
LYFQKVPFHQQLAQQLTEAQYSPSMSGAEVTVKIVENLGRKTKNFLNFLEQSMT